MSAPRHHPRRSGSFFRCTPGSSKGSVRDIVRAIEDKDPAASPQDEPPDFPEPEGLTTNEFLSTDLESLPFDVQIELVRSIELGERAPVRPGYAIEYDYYDRAI